METPQHGNASKKNGLIKLIYCRLLSLKKKYFNNYFTINLGYRLGCAAGYGGGQAPP